MTNKERAQRRAEEQAEKLRRFIEEFGKDATLGDVEKSRRAMCPHGRGTPTLCPHCLGVNH